MSDLISRSALIEEMKTWGGDVESLVEYINNMPTVEAKPVEWIPCSERLPEDETTKIATLSNGKVEGAFWNERNWWCMGDSINLETRTEDVIAWMPLHAPYKEGKKVE